MNCVYVKKYLPIYSFNTSMQCLYTSFLHKDDTIHNVLMFGEVGMLGGGIGV